MSDLPVPTFESENIRIICISDTHNEDSTPSVPDGDILVHSGDMTDYGTMDELTESYRWISALPHKLKIIVAGNHEFGLDAQSTKFIPEALALYTSPEAVARGIRYVERARLVVASLHPPSLESPVPLVVYGNPTQPQWFGAPYAFTYKPYPDESSVAAWADAPASSPLPGLHVWVTHSPPRGRRDHVPVPPLVGCEVLAARVANARPALHVFGHYHTSHGAELVHWKEDAGTIEPGDGGEEDRSWSRAVEKAELLVSDGRAATLDFGDEKLGFVPGKTTAFVNAAYMTMHKKKVNERNEPIVVEFLAKAFQ